MVAYRWADDLKVTCGLTACTAGSAPGPTLFNEYGKALPLLYTYSVYFIFFYVFFIFLYCLIQHLCCNVQ